MKDKIIIMLMVVLIAVMGFMCFMMWNMNNSISDLKDRIITKEDLKDITIHERDGGVTTVNSKRYVITVK